MVCRVMRICVLISLCSAMAFGQQPFDEARNLEQKLMSDILNLKGAQRAVIPEEEQSFPVRIQALLSSAIPQLLDSGATEAQVRVKLDSVLSESATGGVSPGYVAVLAFGNEASRTFVIGYAISYCVMCSRTWLGVYEKTPGGYSPTYSTDEVLPNHTIYLHRLAAIDGTQRFVLYGTGLGSMTNPLSVRAYGLSAGGLKEFWRIDGLNNGTIDFTGDEILLNYIVSPGPGEPRKERIEKYVVSGRVELESWSERAAD